MSGPKGFSFSLGRRSLRLYSFEQIHKSHRLSSQRLAGGNVAHHQAVSLVLLEGFRHMTGLQKVAVIIAATGLVTAAFLPGRQTVKGIDAVFGGVSKWTKVAQGRG